MNHMEKVAKMLDVKLGEHFMIRDKEYYIDKHGLIRYYDKSDSAFPNDSVLSALLRGEMNIEKLPWKPKDGDVFWEVRIDKDAVLSIWNENSTMDLAWYYVGNVFATSEEARKHAPEVIERLKKFYENGESRRNEQ